MTQTALGFRTSGTLQAEVLIECLGPPGTVFVHEGPPLERIYHDCFDARLQAARLALAACNGPGGEHLELQGSRSKRPIRAPGRLGSGFAIGLPEGELRDRVAPVLASRRLLPRLRERRQVTVLERREADDVVLRLEIRRIQCSAVGGDDWIDRGSELRLRPVRGQSRLARRVAAAVADGCEPIGDPLERLSDHMVAVGVVPADPMPGRSPVLQPDMRAAEAIVRLHLALLDSMALVERGSVEHLDAEFLHEFRVAVRRSRSLLSLASKSVLAPGDVEWAVQAFGWLGRQTNAMRDLDVHLESFETYRSEIPVRLRPALAPFRAHLERRACFEQARVAAMLEGSRYLEFRNGWRDRLEGIAARRPNAAVPIHGLADRWIDRAVRRLLRRGRRIDDDSEPEALHRLRVHAKRLRYLLEFFASLYSQRDARALVARLKALQDVLGAFQDASVQSASIRRFADEMESAGDARRDVRCAMEHLADRIEMRQASARRDFQRAFTRFVEKARARRFARGQGSDRARRPPC